jgi:hypothetical protein
MEGSDAAPAPAEAKAATAAPGAATEASATSAFGYVVSFMTQQLLEELGRAKSSETEENAALSRELERLRLDAREMEDLLHEMHAAYGVLQVALGGFGEHLYQLAIKEEEPELAAPLMSSGLCARGLSTQLGEAQEGLGALASGLQQQQKAIQDARDTRESYRVARLAYDAAERALGDAQRAGRGVETAQAERDRMRGRYEELALTVKTKVMLLHQFRIRTLKRQLEETRALFSRVWTACLAKLPARGADAPAHSRAVAALL